MSKTERITVAGFGGQGVMMLGQVLAYVANEKGYNALWHPSYGPETRGGTANCSVIISERPINSPVFSKADTLLIMNRPSLEKFKNKLHQDGVLIYNSSLIQDSLNEQAYPVAANDLALDLGNSQVANMIILGAYLRIKPHFSLDEVYEAVKAFLGPEKEKLFEINYQALKLGFSLYEEKE